MALCLGLGVFALLALLEDENSSHERTWGKNQSCQLFDNSLVLQNCARLETRIAAAV